MAYRTMSFGYPGKENGFGCGTFIFADGKMILLAEEGELITATATPKGLSIISRAQILENICWTPPSLSDGRLLIRDDRGAVACIDLRK